ncbi:phosphatase PAP2 family protein [Pedosphaera parvula]|uniref:Acid phosphatase n=1 Tax=Pedosphaera parvula (strain Ellin514) TaxID=320771 RepID=B9XCB1_PEDPL|nr:phosphatase PAP2 family protein [Pedosphaera parvula]EEF62579.1 phosphoesterase PA-phosphatase related protein [Pedosphaera parvula Ellin514]
MNTSLKPFSRLHSTAWLSAILFSLTVAVTPLHAADKELHYLTAGKPDAATLLPPPSPSDSSEQAAELAEVRTIYHCASSNDIAVAYSEKKFSVFNFTPTIGTFFTATNLPRTAAFFEKVQIDAALVTDAGKDYFRRPRPFTTDPSLANGKLEKSFGYPSGHSTESMVLALVLADLLPDQRDAILDHARLMGWHRVQIARHYPSDIYAGRVLAQAITRQLKESDSFKKDLDAVKTEIAAAQK